MIYLLAILIVIELVAVMFVSARVTKFWLVSPAVMMSAYFIFVEFPGFFLVSDYKVQTVALLAHFVWFSAVFISLVVIWLVANKSLHVYSERTIVIGNKKIFWFFVFLAIPSVAFTFYMFDRVPLFVGIGPLFGLENDISMHAARRMNTLQHRSGDTIYFGQGYFRLIFTVVSPIFLVALLFYSRLTEGIRNDRLIISMMFFLVIAGALNGQIWISVQVVLFFLMAHYYLMIVSGRGVSEISIIYRGLLAYSFLLAFIFSFRYLQFLQGRYFENFFYDTFRRIYSSGSIELFGIFPSQEGFRYGSTWLNDLKGFLPGSIQSFAYEVHYLVHGGALGFTLSPGIVASSFVNFGYLGVFFVGLIFTTIFTLIFSFLIKSVSAIRIAIAIYFSHSFTFAMPGDIVSYFTCLLTAVIMYTSYVFLNSFSRQIFGTRRDFI